MGLSWTMDKIGPICRGVEDCAAALDAIYGPDHRDLTVGDPHFNWNPDMALSALRVGYLKSEFEFTPPANATDQQKQIAEKRNAMYKDALDALMKAGVKMTAIELPKFPTNNLRHILTAEAATAFDDITRNERINELSGQDAGDWPNTFRTNRFVPAVEYLRAQRARVLLMREMDKLMKDWDVFVSPAPGSASLIITNLTGHPAVCLPCGFLDVPAGPNAPVTRLPQAIMFSGGLYDEASPLRVALAFEKATKWHTMHPKVDWA
jgi:Asp-tRNA(Asn)/Glu-tRNA(Gln) amidotransferase A subunit family amidase